MLEAIRNIIKVLPTPIMKKGKGGLRILNQISIFLEKYEKPIRPKKPLITLYMKSTSQPKSPLTIELRNEEIKVWCVCKKWTK